LSEYAFVSIPEVWQGWRNPVHYAALEDFGIDPAQLDFQPMPAVNAADGEHEPSEEPVGHEIQAKNHSEIIRRCCIAAYPADCEVKGIRAALENAGFKGVKQSTILTLRSDCRATLKLQAEMKSENGLTIEKRRRGWRAPSALRQARSKSQFERDANQTVVE
jgi:hypothetical protein